MQAVYSFGGSLIYCEFMSEMRKPWDFWKALICAQSFIYCVYLFFGIYVYSFQGQYTINPANQGIGPRAANTAGNIIYFVASLIAAALYGNIGVKVIYQNILKELFGFPPLTIKSGKVWFAGLVPIYWSLAFIIAAAIPNFNYLSALIAAICIIQFSYTFPPLLMLGALIQRDAIQAGEGFDPATGQTTRHDGGLKRWARGYLKQWPVNTWNALFFLGSLVTAGLVSYILPCFTLYCPANRFKGCYSSIEGLITAFKSGSSTSFSCKH
jgi:hypothetical protein